MDIKLLNKNRELIVKLDDSIITLDSNKIIINNEKKEYFFSKLENITILTISYKNNSIDIYIISFITSYLPSDYPYVFYFFYEPKELTDINFPNLDIKNKYYNFLQSIKNRLK